MSTRAHERKVLAVYGETDDWGKFIDCVRQGSHYFKAVQDEQDQSAHGIESIYIVGWLLVGQKCIWAMLKVSLAGGLLTSTRANFELKVLGSEDELPPLSLRCLLVEGGVIKVVLEQDGGDKSKLPNVLAVLSYCADYDERRRQSAPNGSLRLHSVAPAASLGATIRHEDVAKPSPRGQRYG